MRFHRVRLHDADDPHYKAYLTALLAVKSNQKASRPPAQVALFGGEAEIIVRDWLASLHPLRDKRFVEYDERVGSVLNRKYRELDAVVQPDPTHIHVYEIKASRSVRALHKGLKQLQETRTILRSIIPHVTTTLVIVDTGIPTPADVLTLMQSDDPPARPPQTLADFQAQMPDVPVYADTEWTGVPSAERTLVCVPLATVIARGTALGMELHLDWEESEEELEDAGDVPPAVHYASQDTDDSDDDNPFAAAFRNAQSPRR